MPVSETNPDYYVEQVSNNMQQMPGIINEMPVQHQYSCNSMHQPAVTMNNYEQHQYSYSHLDEATVLAACSQIIPAEVISSKELVILKRLTFQIMFWHIILIHLGKQHVILDAYLVWLMVSSNIFIAALQRGTIVPTCAEKSAGSRTCRAVAVSK